MKSRRRKVGGSRGFVAGAVLIGAVWVGAGQVVAPSPLPRAHAHNDYEHARPLEDALSQGFCGVEADIHLVGGALLVAHDREDVQADRTLRRLYLEPLRLRARRHQGRVYPGGPPLMLLIDIKSQAEPTYEALRPLLLEYADILTVYEPDRIRTNAVMVVLSGNRPEALLAREPVRLAALDGRVPDLEKKQPVTLYPLVSESWTAQFRWHGRDEMGLEDREKLKRLVDQAHAQGRWIRFWAIPDREEGWAAMARAGVDWINTDHLAELGDFLRRNSR